MDPSSSTATTHSQTLQSTKETWRDIFLWRRKRYSVTLLLLTTTIWVLLDIYKFNFITILSWAAMAIVSSLFLYGNVFRLLGKEPPNLEGLEMTEHSTMKIANPIREMAEEIVRWMFRVSAEGEWPIFVKTVAGLLLLSYLASFTDLLTLLYLGTVVGITIPPFYIKYEDRIKRCKEDAMEKTRRMCAMLDDKVVKKMKNKVVHVKVEKDKKLMGKITIEIGIVSFLKRKEIPLQIIHAPSSEGCHIGFALYQPFMTTAQHRRPAKVYYASGRSTRYSTFVVEILNGRINLRMQSTSCSN
ncbi:hypothetical protein ACFE04_024423 [Oxalis oulophora]